MHAKYCRNLLSQKFWYFSPGLLLWALQESQDIFGFSNWVSAETKIIARYVPAKLKETENSSYNFSTLVYLDTLLFLEKKRCEKEENGSGLGTN